MSQKLLLPLLFFLSFLVVSASYAEMVSFEISATVYDVYDPGNVLQGKIPVNATISGTYTFDVSVVDNDPSPDYGMYIQTVTSAPGFDLLVNNESLKSDATVPGYMHEIHIGNSTTDYYHIASWGNQALSNGALVNDINLDLYDDLGSALNTAALSPEPPDPASFTYRDLYIGGSDATSGNYYSVMAKVNTITAPSGNSNPDLAIYQIEATIKDLWDPANALNGAVTVGNALNGTFTVNITTVDEEPAIEFGRYRHIQNTGIYGFDVSSNNLNFKTDTSRVEMQVELYNGSATNDHYMIYSYGENHPLNNGASVMDIGLYLSDDSGTMLSSDELDSNHPSVNSSGYYEIYIYGMHPNGIDSYNITATISGISLVSQQPSLLTISPAAGQFSTMQRFDLALIFQPGIAAVTNMAITINGMGNPPALVNCYPSPTTPPSQQIFVCPDFSDRVYPGNNELIFSIDLLDDTHIIESTSWELIGY